MGEEKVKLKREYKASSIQKVSDNWKLFVKGVGQFKRNSVSVFQEVMNRIQKQGEKGRCGRDDGQADGPRQGMIKDDGYRVAQHFFSKV